MVSLFLAYKLNSKIIHEKGKADGATLVVPKTWFDIALIVAMLLVE